MKIFQNVRRPEAAEGQVMFASTLGSLSLSAARMKSEAGTLTLPEVGANCEGLLLQLEMEVTEEDREVCELLARKGKHQARLSPDQVKVAARGKLLEFATSPGEEAALSALIYGKKP